MYQGLWISMLMNSTTFMVKRLLLLVELILITKITCIKIAMQLRWNPYLRGLSKIGIIRLLMSRGHRMEIILVSRAALLKILMTDI